MIQKQEIFTLLDGKVLIHRGVYNPTSDAVWLASFCPKNIKTVLDVGIGTGGASLCLLTHIPQAKIMGIDNSSERLAECAKNVELNGKSIELIKNDIFYWKTEKTFDLVISNPPYFKGTPAKHEAHHNVDLSLWVKKSIARVRPRGYFCVIVDTSASGEIIATMHEQCGDINIFPLFGSKTTAERVLIRCRKGTKSGTTLYKGLSMNDKTILRDGLTIEAALSRLS